MSVLPKNKKATVGIGIATAAAAAIALGGGTYAAFSDTETGPSATLAAGTLNLEVGANPAEAQNFTAEKIAPGYRSQPYTVKFKNAGTVPGKLALAFTVVEAENGCTEPETKIGGDTTCTGTDGELGESLNVTITGPGVSYTGKIGNAPTSVGGPLAAEQEVAYTVVYDLPTTVGNEVQSDGVAVTTNATLEQVTS